MEIWFFDGIRSPLGDILDIIMKGNDIWASLALFADYNNYTLFVLMIFVQKILIILENTIYNGCPYRAEEPTCELRKIFHQFVSDICTYFINRIYAMDRVFLHRTSVTGFFLLNLCYFGQRNWLWEEKLEFDWDSKQKMVHWSELKGKCVVHQSHFLLKFCKTCFNLWLRLYRHNSRHYPNWK